MSMAVRARTAGACHEGHRHLAGGPGRSRNPKGVPLPSASVRSRLCRSAARSKLRRAPVVAGLFVLGLVAHPGLAEAASPYASAVIGDHPSVYYRLAETAGPTAHDSSGHSQHAQYSSSGITHGVQGALI